MTVDEFIRLPWQNIAGFVGFLIALTILFSKWIPGVRQLMESLVTWLGDLFTARMADKLDTVIEKLNEHIKDADAHRGQNQ